MIPLGNRAGELASLPADARREQLETFQGLSPESQDPMLVLTVLYVPGLRDRQEGLFLMSEVQTRHI